MEVKSVLSHPATALLLYTNYKTAYSAWITFFFSTFSHEPGDEAKDCMRDARLPPPRQEGGVAGRVVPISSPAPQHLVLLLCVVLFCLLACKL